MGDDILGKRSGWVERRGSLGGRSPGGEWDSVAAGGGAGKGMLEVTVADSVVTLLLEGRSRRAPLSRQA